MRATTLRSKNRDLLNADIEKTLANNTSEYWIKKLNDDGVAAVRSTGSTTCSPIRRCSISALRPTCETPDRGTLKVVRQPVSLSRTPSAIARPTPERGEHTDEVLTEFGFSADEIEELRKAGAT